MHLPSASMVQHFAPHTPGLAPSVARRVEVSRLSRSLVAAGMIICASPAAAQSLTTVNARFDAWSPGTTEKMTGKIRMNVLKFSGTVHGRTTTGITCTGSVSINLLFSGGTGKMSCKDGRTATFTYALTSSLPPRGTGQGKVSNGKTIKFRIKPG